LLVLAHFAHAQALPVATYPTANSMRVPVIPVAGQGVVGRSITTAANDAVVLDLIKGKIGARELDITVRRLITPANIAKGIIKGGLVGAAMGLVADMLLTTRCRANAGGSWSCDAGQPKQPQESWVSSTVDNACASGGDTAAYSCAARAALAAFVVSGGTTKELRGTPTCAAYSYYTHNCTGLYFHTVSI